MARNVRVNFQIRGAFLRVALAAAKQRENRHNVLKKDGVLWPLSTARWQFKALGCALVVVGGYGNIFPIVEKSPQPLELANSI